VFEVLLTVDKADPEVDWRAEVGVVTALLDRITFNPLNSVVFMCGPEIMVHRTVPELVARGVPGEKIFISLERNMNCGTGVCGHCMFGPKFVCKDGPVFRFTDIEQFLKIREI
jgi:NAD(P)H-flavin reductase